MLEGSTKKKNPKQTKKGKEAETQTRGNSTQTWTSDIWFYSGIIYLESMDHKGGGVPWMDGF